MSLYLSLIPLVVYHQDKKRFIKPEKRRLAMTVLYELLGQGKDRG